MAKSLSSKFLTALFALSTLVCVTTSFGATTDTLADLANGGTLSIGDKIFNNFSFQNSGLTTFDPSQITVTASFNANSGTYFLTFDGNMGLTSTGPITADLLLRYSVTATNGLINAIDSSFTGSATPHETSFLSVDETARDANGNVVGSTHVDDTNPPGSHSSTFPINPPQRTLNITKDIGFAIVKGNGFVTVSEISQSFHQTQVPEPGTAMLLGVGLLSGSFFLRRRRR